MGWLSLLAPYIKIFLMFLGFVLPKDLLSEERRESLLVFTENIAKAVVLNFFVTLFFAACFYFTVQLGDNISASFYMRAETGFFLYLPSAIVFLGL